MIQLLFNQMNKVPMLDKILITISSFLLSFILPVVPTLTVCFLLIIIDTYYGIKVAIHLKNKIESRRNWKGIFAKTKNTAVILLAIHAIEEFILGKYLPEFSIGVTTFAILISLNEVLSIIENLNTIDPDGPWRLIAKFLRKKGSNHFEIDFENDNKSKKSAKV